MGGDAGFPVLCGTGASTHTVDRSQFLGLASPVDGPDQFSRLLASVRADHPKTRHTAWAYVLADGTARSSDDGEPSGTAGKPILDILSHEGLRDAAVLITRYFGGVLLGTGGLVRAYGTAARLCLDAAPRARRLWASCAGLTVPYGLLDRVSAIARKLGGDPQPLEWGEQVRMRVLFDPEPPGGGAAGRPDVPDALVEFIRQVGEVSSGSVVPQILDPVLRQV